MNRLTLILFIFLNLGVIHIEIDAQNELELKQYFEGSFVVLKMNMPATKEGVNVYPTKPNKINYEKYSQKLKSNSIALYEGDRAMITKIKLKKKHIEFQLDGGGYGTFGDERVNNTRPIVPKSKREEELNDLINDESDEDKKKELKKERDRLVKQRNYDQRISDQNFNTERSIQEESIRNKALQAGSRFNIYYPEKLDGWDIQPDDIKRALADYVDFESRNNLNQSSNQSSDIYKGLSWEEAAQILGMPDDMSQNNDCGIKLVNCTFNDANRIIKATFAEGILIRYTINSN